MKKSMALITKISKYFRLPARERILLPVAFALCGVFRFALLFIPFKYLAPLMSKRLKTPLCGNLTTLQQNIRLVTKMVHYAARMTPWESKCLVRALTAKILLRWFGCSNELYLGVRRDSDGGLIAHAWINSNGMNVSGGSSEVNSSYAVVGVFSDLQ